MQSALLVLGVLLVLTVIIVVAYLEVPFVEQGRPRKEDVRVVLVILGLIVLLAVGAALYYALI